jgi:hypothetical protein
VKTDDEMPELQFQGYWENRFPSVYCWSCFIELTVNGEKMSVYQVEEDGTLSSLDDLFFGEPIPEPIHATGI